MCVAEGLSSEPPPPSAGEDERRARGLERAIDVPWRQIEEALLQTTPYAGVPRAVNAIKVLRAQQEEESAT